MPSTYSQNLKIELIATGEQTGIWGNTTNTNLGTALEQSITGVGEASFTSDANLTLPLTDSNASQVARNLVLNVTSVGSLTATRELIVPTVQKQYLVWNNTTGGQSIVVKTTAGTGITVLNGDKMHLMVDGTNVVRAVNFAIELNATVEGSDGSSDWTQASSSDPYIATITVPGLLSTDSPIVDIDLSSVAFADVPNTQDEWAFVYLVEASDDNELKLYALDEPANDFELLIKVVR